MKNRKCAVCGHLNEEDRVYCRMCGGFLYGDTAAQLPGRVKSIWEIDMERFPESRRTGAPAAAEKPVRQKKESRVFVCPVCGARYPDRDGRPPLLCTNCDYFFQESDRSVREEGPGPEPAKRQGEEKERKTGAETAVRQETSPGGRSGKGPMRRAQKDVSSLRLLGLSRTAPFVFEAAEEGNILGRAGTVLPELFQRGIYRKVMPQHLVIWHTPVGWYLRALAGITLHNGSELNTGASVRLSGGDFINAGDCSIRIEITVGHGA